MHARRQAWILAGCTVAMWSTVATAFELGLRGIGPAGLLAGANLVAVIALFGICVVRGSVRRAFTVDVRGHRNAALLGLLNPAVYYLVLFEAYARLPGQVAQSINYSWAITLALLSVPVLGQRLSRGELGAMLLAWFGVVVIATNGNFTTLQTDDPVGVLVALASTILWSAYWLLSARDPREPISALLLNFCYALPITMFIAWWTGTDLDLSALTIGAIIWIGLAEMAVAFVTWRLAMERATSTAAISSLIFISPFLSLVLLATIAGEEIRSATPVGLALIVAGVALQQWQQRRQGESGGA